MMIAAFLGVAVGVVLGLTGAGGGILAVPALVFGLGMTLAEAAPVALVAVATAASIGALEGLKRGLVRYRAALFMAAVGMVFAPLGLKVAAASPERLLLSAFAIAMAIVAARMLLQAKAADGAPPQGEAPCHLDPATGRLQWTRRTVAALGAIGAAAGFLTGLLGVGGGFLIVPALRRFSDITMQGIVATSLAVIALVSAGSVIAAAFQSHAAPAAIAVPFAAAAAGGMLLGRFGARRLPQSHLQRLFAIVTLVVAAGMALRA